MPNKILLAERILLQTLGFDLQLTHPYRACLDKIKDSLRRKSASSSNEKDPNTLSLVVLISENCAVSFVLPLFPLLP